MDGDFWLRGPGHKAETRPPEATGAHADVPQAHRLHSYAASVPGGRPRPGSPFLRPGAPPGRPPRKVPAPSRRDRPRRPGLWRKPGEGSPWADLSSPLSFPLSSYSKQVRGVSPRRSCQSTVPGPGALSRLQFRPRWFEDTLVPTARPPVPPSGALPTAPLSCYSRALSGV